MRHVGSIAVILVCALLGRDGVAQPVTTVITHGLLFTQGNPPDLAPWTIGLGDAIAARSPSGLVYIYDPPSGEWMGPSNPQASDDIVLVFNWVDESDGGIFCPFPFPGENWGYTEAAGDALYAALRDPSGDLVGLDLIDERFIHMLAHSRGASVIDKTVRLLGADGIEVDHMTTMDPHPVNGTLDQCLLFGQQLWGDQVPMKWSNVAFLDNYYRTDGDICDFDGMPLGWLDVLLPENVLETSGQGYGASHSDTHLWYHGTADLGVNISDGEETIDQAMRDTWWTGGLDESVTGYHFSRLAGGWMDRPAQSMGPEPPKQLTLINGDFEMASLFGWMAHGGGGPGEVVDDADGQYLRLSTSGAKMTHNWFFLPDCGQTIDLRYRVFVGGADDRLVFSLTDRSGVETTFDADAIPLDDAGAWTVASVDLGSFAPGQSLLLTATIEDALGGAIGATVGIDDLVVGVGFFGDGNGDGVVNFADVTAVLANWLVDYGVGNTGPGDADGNGVVNFADITSVLGNWLEVCL